MSSVLDAMENKRYVLQAKIKEEEELDLVKSQEDMRELEQGQMVHTLTALWDYMFSGFCAP